MDKTWYDKKMQESEDAFKKLKEVFEAQDWVDFKDVEQLFKENEDNILFSSDEAIWKMYHSLIKQGREKEFLDLVTWIELNHIKELIKKYRERLWYKRYLDSDPVEFDGDIIITDPGYVVCDDDWEKSNYGEELDILGIHTYMTRDTIEGDWSCYVRNTDTNEKMGEFCSDAGLVSVLYLSEVLKYNPDFDYHETKPWTTTLIKDFKGTVQFKVHKRNEERDCFDFYVQVEGHGVNKITGEPINFVGGEFYDEEE